MVTSLSRVKIPAEHIWGPAASGERRELIPEDRVPDWISMALVVDVRCEDTVWGRNGCARKTRSLIGGEESEMSGFEVGGSLESGSGVASDGL